MTDEKGIEGYVDCCSYSNERRSDFPGGLLGFRLRDQRGNLLEDGPYHITGQSKPPLQNGHYVKGEIFESRDTHNQTIKIVSRMAIFDRTRREKLAGYEF